MGLELMELFQYSFKFREEVLPRIVAQIICSEHEIDPVILFAAQSLIDGNIAIRCGNDRLSHITGAQTDTCQECTLRDTGGVPEAFHS